MKKILVIMAIVMSFALMMTSCQKQDSSGRPIISDEFNTKEMAEAISITALYWNEPNVSSIDSITSFIEQEYGVNLKISLIQDYDLTGSKTANLVRNTEEGGIYFFGFTSLDTIKRMAEANEILPLDEFLKYNETWKALPEEMKQMYKIGDGNIWTVSRSYDQNVFGRVYRKEYLNLLNLTVPKSLGELYEVSKRLSEAKTNAIGMFYYNALSFNDIFYANNTPLAQSHTGMNITSIVYDRNSLSYEDSMLKPDMESTLYFIINLIEEKIAVSVGTGRNRGPMSIGIMSNDDRLTNGYGLVPAAFFGDEKYEVSYGIEGKQKEFINPLTSNYTSGYYVLSSKTSDASKVINTFISLFYGDLKGYIVTTYGAPGDRYSFNGDTVVINDLSFFNSNSFSIVDSNPLYNISNIELSASGETADMIELFKYRIEARDQYISNGISSGKMFSLTSEEAYPLVYPSLDDFIMSNPASQLLDNVFQNVLLKFISPSEGIKEYRDKMKQLGMQETVDRLNEQTGVKTSYQY